MGLISSQPEDKGLWLLVKLQLILHLKKPMEICWRTSLASSCESNFSERY